MKPAIAAALISLGLWCAPAGHADDPSLVGPAVGSPCAHFQMNTTTTANSGEQVRCVSVYGGGYAWLPDVGPQYDPSIAAQGAQAQAAAYDYCLQHHARPEECSQIIYGTP